MKTTHSSLAALLLLATACAGDPGERPAPAPAADAARAQGDPRAIAVAERVLAELGGREAWERTRAVSWRFMGRRLHVWDKHTGELRLEEAVGEGDARKQRVVLIDLDTKRGRVAEDGREVTDPVARDQALERAYGVWVNDSYWMFMPFKLLDPGVRLSWDGVDRLEDGRAADVLSLTFDGVGLTPGNRYRVFVAQDTGLVEAWSFYAEASDSQPKFTLPWGGWRAFGTIRLSTEHGRGDDWEIAVHGELPRAVFEDLGPVEIPR